MTRSPAETAVSTRILQLTDTHLFADPQGSLLGLNTRECLDAVIDMAIGEQDFELVVASGDLTHDGSAAACLALRESFSRLQAPVFCLPGNHDESTMLREHLDRDRFSYTSHTHTGDWLMIFVDSTMAGSEGGHLSEAELEQLDELLCRWPEKPAIVWLHHQPVPIGSDWLDTMAVDNGDAFFSVLDAHSQVRAVIWGHVHQEFTRIRKGVHLLGTPSTCVQFLPGSETFATDTRPPGYRWLRLYANGSFETGISRLKALPGRVDPQVAGY